MYTTRFNPTTNGYLHIGHLYLALVNQAEAKESGGKFIVRFDDNQRYWTVTKQVDTVHLSQEMKKDLSWMGVVADEYESQFDLENEAFRLMKTVRADLQVREAFFSDVLPEVLSSRAAYYPYVPHITAEKVAMDFLEGVNLLIRGEDLLDEFTLYTYFCDAWGIPNPRHVYLPRLKLKDNGELSDISKTKGNWSLRYMRDMGESKDSILKRLAESCLKDKKGPWLIYNIKERPLWE